MALLTLGGTDIHSRTGIFLDLKRGYFESASLRGRDLVIPGANGQTIRSRRTDTRLVLLEGYVTGTSSSDFGTNGEALRALLAGLTPIDLVIADGYLGTTGTKTLSVRCVPPSLFGDALYVLAKPYMSASVELISVSPDWT